MGLIGAAAIAMIASAPLALQSKPGKPFPVNQLGGQSGRSADQQWRIESRAGDDSKPDNDSRSMASLWLRGVGGAERRLTTYRRDGTVIWLGSGRHAVLAAKDAHFHDIRLFTLDEPNAPQRTIQLLIERSMAATPPRLGSVENRLISVSPAPGGGLCLRVEESGLPPGRNLGSFISKTGTFRVAPNGAAMRVKACPGPGGSTPID